MKLLTVISILSITYNVQLCKSPSQLKSSSQVTIPKACDCVPVSRDPYDDQKFRTSLINLTDNLDIYKIYASTQLWKDNCQLQIDCNLAEAIGGDVSLLSVFQAYLVNGTMAEFVIDMEEPPFETPMIRPIICNTTTDQFSVDNVAISFVGCGQVVMPFKM